MKQRIRVVGIVSRNEEFLLLKRMRGRIEELPSWELPTGKIRFGEQPEEAMGRTMYEYLGVQVDSIKLKDVITFTGIAGASQQANLYIVYEIQLRPEARLVASERYSAYKFVKNIEMTGMKLDEATIQVLTIESGRVMPTFRDLDAMGTGTTGQIEGGTTEVSTVNAAASGATVYIDGASRGNPGPAGIGYYIVGENGRLLKRGGEFIGFATSRVAEYYALKEGCEQAIELGLKRVRFVGDNLMLVNQMRGIYQVKNQDIRDIYNDVQKLLPHFEAVAFMHVKRGMNQAADKEANLAINRHFDEE